MAGKQPAASAEKLVSVVAVEPVEHNGVHFAPGSPFEVTEAQAEVLLASGAAQAPEAVQGELPA